jgi:hypothetical protein
MSLVLSKSLPKDLEVKTHGTIFRGKDLVLLRGSGVDCEIPIRDFLYAVEYVLTNTDLRHRDPRLKFLKTISKLKQITGYNQENKRLGTAEEELA